VQHTPVNKYITAYKQNQGQRNTSQKIQKNLSTYFPDKSFGNSRNRKHISQNYIGYI
jgi:hypothetical protein